MATHEIPETDNADVARMALAWNIVVATNYTGKMSGQQAEVIRSALVKAYIETYNAILANERGETDQKT